MEYFSNLVKLARPCQYTKNLFVFLPAFFAFKINELETIVSGFFAFLSFSLVASSVYIFNDWVDLKEDAKHPTKYTRPLASGTVSAKAAFTTMASLLMAGGALLLMLPIQALFVIIFYLLLNFAYTIKLKHIAIIDISIIATGFVLRLLVGSVATSVQLSPWIIVMTFLLALFLSLAKRRDDVLIYLQTDQKMRKVIDGYNLKFLDASMMLTASITLVAYILWSISPEVTQRLGSDNLYLSSVFVLLGILRYLQLVLVEEKSGNPSKILLKDRFIQLVLTGWLGIFVWILYLSAL